MVLYQVCFCTFTVYVLDPDSTCISPYGSGSNFYYMNPNPHHWKLLQFVDYSIEFLLTFFKLSLVLKNVLMTHELHIRTNEENYITTKGYRVTYRTFNCFTVFVTVPNARRRLRNTAFSQFCGDELAWSGSCSKHCVLYFKSWVLTRIQDPNLAVPKGGNFGFGKIWIYRLLVNCNFLFRRKWFDFVLCVIECYV